MEGVILLVQSSENDLISLTTEFNMWKMKKGTNKYPTLWYMQIHQRMQKSGAKEKIEADNDRSNIAC